MRHRDRELQTDPSSGTYNLDQQEVYRGEELEKIAVLQKKFGDANGNNAQVQDSERNAEGKRLQPRRSGNRKSNGRRGSKENTRETLVERIPEDKK